jgi:ribosome biogenesis GTPase
MSLSFLGWDDFFANHFQSRFPSGFVPARVTAEHKQAYVLHSAHGEFTAECTGRLIYNADGRADFPAVGDWVAVRLRSGATLPGPDSLPRADIHAILPRRTKFSRHAAGDAESEQILAANVDTVCLVTALDQNFNLRRIERYLAAAWESGAQPVVVLNKADLHPDPVAAQAEVESVALGAPVATLSATRAESLDALAPWLAPGRTLAFLGSSGVGKSTLINGLLGTERPRTRAVSDAVGKGRHTTTHRELFVAPAGWCLIDTPGMRELQLWNVTAAAVDATFADIAALTTACRFSDCTHRAEPGCAVQAALESGSLEMDRWQSFQKLQREQAYAARKADPRLARAENARWKKIHLQHRVRDRLHSED